MVSIIIPVYNRANIIERTVNNILQQTYKEIEVIVVDDGSTDNIDDVMQHYKDDRVRYIKIEQNMGACYARNVGVRAAKGEYIAFQDSDDLWMDEKIEHQLECIKSSNFDICICRMMQIYENGKRKEFHGETFSQQSITVENELGKSFFSTQLIFGKKGCFLEEPFDETFPRFQDWDLGIRLVKKYKIIFLDEILVERYLQSNSVSNNSSKGYIAGKLLLEKYHEDYIQYPKAKAKFLAFYAKLQELNNESSHEYLKESLYLDFKMKTLAKYMLQSVGLYRIYLKSRT